MTEPEHPGIYMKRKLDRFQEVSNLPPVTVAEYAEEIGISKSTADRLFSGKQKLTPKVALLIANAFGMQAEELMSMNNLYYVTIARNKQAVKLARERHGAK
jgi:plasmid maintenance system antidote protein VapI